ncbi:MAG: phosphoenolpyruvate kinase [Planctomycetes bacterium]|nr:phosphoenolpyruvate kinase [Planctomycetota bacterium]
MDEIHSTLFDDLADSMGELGQANREFAMSFPGDRPDRQPIHTVYGGAQLFSSKTTAKLGQLALASLNRYAPDATTFAAALGLPTDGDLATQVYERVRARLETEPVEDFRIDFEDGFGVRPDPEEDATAVRAARELAVGMREGTLPPFVGIRIKPLNDEMRRRSIRTLDVFVRSLLDAAGKLPDNFVVTLPKVPIPEQVTALVNAFEHLEHKLGLPDRSLRLELMIELTQSLLDARGYCVLPRLAKAAEGRCVAAHFGTYDYTASCGITAAHQRMDHPACDFALHWMKVAFAGTGIWLSDGATNVMPVGPHAGKPESLTAEQERENRQVVHDAWRLAAKHIRHSLENAFYQGWDLHPAQLPVRYGMTYAFFLEGFEAAAERLANFVEKAAQATLVGEVFDDAATGQGLLNYFLRGLNCGAVSMAELGVTGLSVEEIRTRSFARILRGRGAVG